MFKHGIFRSRVLEPPEVVKIIFDQYSHNGTMSLDNLHDFLVEFQGEDKATKDDAQAIFNSLKHLNIFPRRGLHLEAFFRYLLGELNGPLSPSRGVHHDMTAPLAHYFRYTGHKSFLSLNERNGVRPIVKALRRGVRVIDLDLWLNSTEDKVMVCYERQLHDASELLECLQAIKDKAFQASKYPVEIIFEEHLSINLRAKVAEMVAKTFGDMLYRLEIDQLQEFPSPESLKNKVMISTKPSKKYLETQNSKSPQKSKASSNRETRDDEKKVTYLSLSIGELENAIQIHTTDFIR